MAVTKAILEKWMVEQKRHRLFDKQVQMARELGLNPGKLGKIVTTSRITKRKAKKRQEKDESYKMFFPFPNTAVPRYGGQLPLATPN